MEDAAGGRPNRKRRAPDADAGNSKPDGAGAGAASTSAAGRKKPSVCELTSEQIDAELGTALSKLRHTSKVIKKEVVMLRKIVDGLALIEENATTTSIGCEHALVAALEHDDVSLVRHGGEAFRRLAEAAPRLLLSLLASGGPLAAALKKHDCTHDLKLARLLSEGIMHLAGLGGAPAWQLATAEVLQTLFTIFSAHDSDRAVARCALRALRVVQSRTTLALQRENVFPSVRKALQAHQDDAAVVADGVAMMWDFFYPPPVSESGSEWEDVAPADLQSLAVLLCTLLEEHPADAAIAKHACGVLYSVLEVHPELAAPLLQHDGDAGNAGLIEALASVLKRFVSVEDDDIAAEAVDAATTALSRVNRVVNDENLRAQPLSLAVVPLATLLARWSASYSAHPNDEDELRAVRAALVLERVVNLQPLCKRALSTAHHGRPLPASLVVQAMRSWLPDPDDDDYASVESAVVRLGAYILDKVSGAMYTRVPLHSCGASEVLLLTVAHSSSDCMMAEAVEAACSALGNLASDAAVRRSVLKHSSLEAAAARVSEKSKMISRAVAHLLVKLAQSPECVDSPPPHFADAVAFLLADIRAAAPKPRAFAPAASPLRGLLQSAQDAAGRLGDLAHSSPEAALQLRLRGLDQTLVATLHGPAVRDAGFTQHAVAALQRLAAVPHNRPAMLQRGVLQAIAHVLGWHKENEEICRAACDLAAHLALAAAGTPVSAPSAGVAGASLMASLTTVLSHYTARLAKWLDAGDFGACDNSSSGSSSDAGELVTVQKIFSAFAAFAAVAPEWVAPGAAAVRAAAATMFVKLGKFPRGGDLVSAASLLLSCLDQQSLQLSLPGTATGAGAGAGVGPGAREASDPVSTASAAAPFALAAVTAKRSAAGIASHNDHASDAEAPSRLDFDAPIIAAALCAAARGDAEALAGVIGDGSMLAVPLDLSAVVQMAASAGHTDVVEMALRCLAAQSSSNNGSSSHFASSVSDVGSAGVVGSEAAAAVAAALQIACAAGPRAELLLQHLLDEWRAVPTRSTFWLAAEQRSVSMLDRLLQCSAWKDPGRPDKAIIRRDRPSNSGDFELLEQMLASPSLRPVRPDSFGSELPKATALAVAQRLLLDSRADPAAAGSEAFVAAASQGRVAVLEALLADPRVDGSHWAFDRLVCDPSLPAASMTLLARQPNVLRMLALPVGDAAPLRPHALTALDAAALAAAAWRRRRAAVGAWWGLRQ